MDFFKYSEQQKEKIAYSFDPWEAELIKKCIAPQIKKIEKKIKAIEEHPDNEGQATFSMQIHEHRKEIECINYIIKYL